MYLVLMVAPAAACRTGPPAGSLVVTDEADLPMVTLLLAADGTDQGEGNQGTSSNQNAGRMHSFHQEILQIAAA